MNKSLISPDRLCKNNYDKNNYLYDNDDILLSSFSSSYGISDNNNNNVTVHASSYSNSTNQNIYTDDNNMGLLKSGTIHRQSVSASTPYEYSETDTLVINNSHNHQSFTPEEIATRTPWCLFFTHVVSQTLLFSCFVHVSDELQQNKQLIICSLYFI